MLIADTPYPLHVQNVVLSNGISLAYTAMGRGFPLLLVHGLGSYLPAWTKNLPFLSEHFRCIALDLPGYGKSSKEGFTPGMEFYADVLHEFLDKLQIKECYLTGHSMGGQVVIHTALKYPQKVKKLALLAPAGLETFTADEGRQMKAWFAPEKVCAAGADIIEQNVKANFYHFPADARGILQDRLHYKACDDYPRFCQVLSDSVAAMLQEPVYEKLSQLSMPVLILFGRQDAYIPSLLLHPNLQLKDMVEQASARIPKGSFRFVNSCGHFIQWEGAEEVNRYLLGFLEG
jgi:pimeloyl-ACP methyl ester carboxylesterase